MTLDSTVSLNTLLIVVAILVSWGTLFWRVGAIEKKLPSFITRLEVTQMQESEDAEHEAIRRELNGLVKRIERR